MRSLANGLKPVSQKKIRQQTGTMFMMVLVCAIMTAGLISAATWNVASGGNLQTAINSASLGDTIMVAAGATFVGPFTLPVKSGTNYLVIRSNAADAALPAPGNRISPNYAGVLPKLVSPGANSAVLSTDLSAHHYKLIGLEFSPATDSTICSEIVKLGEGGSTQNNLSLVAHDLILDRCYIHGSPTNLNVKRGISLQSGYTEIKNCWISDCHLVGADAQAICGWNGPGPYLIDNNYLSGSGENVMFGGADPAILNLIPSDITITNNYFFKPLSWRVEDPSYAGIHWSIKNIFEIKNAQRVRLAGNVLENCWSDGQTGFALVLKATEQNGTAPWSACKDIDIDSNIVVHAGCGINIAGQTNPASGFRIRNNLFYDIDGTKWGGGGMFMQATNTNGLLVDHNTVIQTGSICVAYGAPCSTFVFTNNIVAHNTYGIKGDGANTGSSTLSIFFPNAVVQRNVMAEAPSGTNLSYPSGNFFPATWTGAGFIDMAGGNYRLSGTSPYKNGALDGTDIGYIYGTGSSAVIHPAIPGRPVGSATSPGYGKSACSLYDLSGRIVRTNVGDRISTDLAQGSYFLKNSGLFQKIIRITRFQ